MEYLLKCYLDQFTEMPRNSLHDVRKRRSTVEYISTLIEGCRRGEGCDSEKPTRDAIIAIIRYHDLNRLENGCVCMMGKYHNILYVAVRLCYLWQLQDTATVCTLLEQIYLCESTFERIFIGAIFGTKAPHYIAGWKSDFDDQEDNLRGMVYFIDHATNGNLELVYGEKSMRFIDIPIDSCGKASLVKLAVQLGLPDKLHIFLRYGAQIEDSQENLNLIEHVMKRLMEFCHVYPYNLVACLQLLLRVVPRIQLDLEPCYQCVRDKILEDFKDLVDDCIVPLKRCGIEIPELKHLCRCEIRKCLWRNYQLPNGIRTLPIPLSLQRYIDIMED